MKDKDFWKIFGYNKKDLDTLIKCIQNHNIVYH